jgi:hypothetical protein
LTESEFEDLVVNFDQISIMYHDHKNINQSKSSISSKMTNFQKSSDLDLIVEENQEITPLTQQDYYREIFLRDKLFAIRGAKPRFYKLYGILPANLNYFLKKQRQDSVIASHIIEFYTKFTPVNQWKKMGQLHPLELEKENPLLCYDEKGRIGVKKEKEDDLL